MSLGIFVLIRLYVVKFVFPDLNLAQPFRVTLLFKTYGQRVKACLNIAENILVYLNVFVDLIIVDLKLNDLRLVAELFSVARNAVGKTRGAGDHQITFGGDHTGLVSAVHTDVAHAERVACGDRAESHQRAANGSVDQLGKGAELLARVGADDSAAGVDHRAL